MQVLVGMGFLSIMKVRGDGVLKKVHQQIAAQQQQRPFAAGESQALGHHLDQRGSQHEARTQRDEIAQVVAVPMLLHDDGTAEHVR